MADKLYIKFRYVDDVYAIQPSYDLKLEGSGPDILRVCPRCGATLFIPTQLPEGAEIVQPRSDVYRPFPIEHPHLAVRGTPESVITLTWALPVLDAWENYDRKRRLKRYISMADVGDDYATMLIEAFSRAPVEHICGQ